MTTSRCAFSTASALRRVFILPIEQQTRLQPLSLTPFAFPTRRGPNLQQRRCVLVNLTKAEKSRLPRDDEITDRYVRLIDSNNKLTPSRPIYTILNTLNRKTQTLVMITRDENNEGGPIVKIQDKQTLRENERELAKKQKKSAKKNASKTLELNWAIEKGDLRHRLKRMKEFLGKGFKVEVVLAQKRKGRKAEEEEASALIRAIREAVKDLEGASEDEKRVEGKWPGEMKLFFKGKKPKVVKEDGTVVEEDEEEDEDGDEERGKEETVVDIKKKLEEELERTGTW